MKYTIYLIALAVAGSIGLSLTSGPDSTREILQEPLEESILAGEAVYTANCMSCHQLNGEGLPGVYPPLAGSDHLNPEPENLVNIVLKGQNKTYTANGNEYSVPMESFAYLSDKEVADVLNYIGNSWGNAFEPVTEQQVDSLFNAAQ